MKELDELLAIFQKEIAKKDRISSENNSSDLPLTNMYLYKIRDYFLVYMEQIIIQKKYQDRVSLFWEAIFTRDEIINSAVFYVENNKPKSEPDKSKKRKLVSIEEYLIAFNQFNEIVLEKKYSNSTLYKSKPFNENLNQEIRAIVESHGYEFIDSQQYPAITEAEYKYILDFFKKQKKITSKDKDVYIIFRLLLLYGLPMPEIRNLKRKHFDLDRRIIIVADKYSENSRTISLELPYSLAKDVEEHFNSRKWDVEDYIFSTTTNKKIPSNYISTHLSNIANLYADLTNDLEVKNKFTSYGLIKFAICNMLSLSMNIPSIVTITGRPTVFIESCRPNIMNNSFTTSHFINSKLHATDAFNEFT